MVSENVKEQHVASTESVDHKEEGQAPETVAEEVPETAAAPDTATEHFSEVVESQEVPEVVPVCFYLCLC